MKNWKKNFQSNINFSVISKKENLIPYNNADIILIIC